MILTRIDTKLCVMTAAELNTSVKRIYQAEIIGTVVDMPYKDEENNLAEYDAPLFLCEVAL